MTERALQAVERDSLAACFDREPVAELVRRDPAAEPGALLELGQSGGWSQYTEREGPMNDQAKRITHGRHCTCGACASEDWTNPRLAPCGMHGSSCPREYQPLGRPGMYEDSTEPQPVITERMIERAALWMDVATNGEERASRDGPAGGPAREHWRRMARGAFEAALR